MLVSLMEKSKKSFVTKYPSEFPASIHSKPFPECKGRVDWAQGTQWQDPKSCKRNKDTTFRKVFQLEIDSKEEEGLHKVAVMITRKGLEKKTFGQHAYVTLQSRRDATVPHKKAWEKHVKYSGTVNVSMGSATMTGLKNPDAEVQMERIDKKPVGKMSVRSVITQVLDTDGRRLFQFVVKDG